MRSATGFIFALYGIFLLLLVSSVAAENVNGEALEPSSLTLWQRIVSSVKDYPWQSDQKEKETPEVAHRRSIVWQRLTMATVL
ncbi:uncharacterized protein LOC110178573 [Drosophila serrata]|uniref:uncharacterized protein LOC110178573 n=1 Tax=Drosophila serrata TaxID=7274 RepID=UPI000A1D17DA|nr:uncharacterized protein LOC110178573 [Drosophila serrata]